jgi:hypothetical protein
VSENDRKGTNEKGKPKKRKLAISTVAGYENEQNKCVFAVHFSEKKKKKSTKTKTKKEKKKSNDKLEKTGERK